MWPLDHNTDQITGLDHHVMPLSQSPRPMTSISDIVYPCVNLDGLYNHKQLFLYSDFNNFSRPLGTEDLRGGGDGGGGDSEESCKDEGLEMAEGSNTSLVDVAGALSLISNKGGRRISASADGAPKDAYMGFLLLRHLRIRDLRAKVGGRESVVDWKEGVVERK